MQAAQEKTLLDSIETGAEAVSVADAIDAAGERLAQAVNAARTVYEDRAGIVERLETEGDALRDRTLAGMRKAAAKLARTGDPKGAKAPAAEADADLLRLAVEAARERAAEARDLVLRGERLADRGAGLLERYEQLSDAWSFGVHLAALAEVASRMTDRRNRWPDLGHVAPVLDDATLEALRPWLEAVIGSRRRIAPGLTGHVLNLAAFSLAGFDVGHFVASLDPGQERVDIANGSRGSGPRLADEIEEWKGTVSDFEEASVALARE
jgi:hypothetical protein